MSLFYFGVSFISLFRLIGIRKFFEKFFAVQFNDFYKIEPLGGYLGYFLLGFYIHNFNIKNSIKKFIYVGALASIGFITYGTYYLTRVNNGILDDYFYGYTNPFVLVVSIAIFLIIKDAPWSIHNNTWFIKIVFAVSSSSFGIYIIHPVVMKLLYETNMAIVSENFNPLMRIPLLDIIVLIVSMIAVLIIRKIPYLKMLVP